MTLEHLPYLVAQLNSSQIDPELARSATSRQWQYTRSPIQAAISKMTAKDFTVTACPPVSHQALKRSKVSFDFEGITRAFCQFPQRWLIKGDRYSGKSTLFKKLALQLAQAGNLVFLIEAQQQQSFNLTPTEAVLLQIESLKDRGIINLDCTNSELLNSGSCIILIDDADAYGTGLASCLNGLEAIAPRASVAANCQEFSSGLENYECLELSSFTPPPTDPEPEFLASLHLVAQQLVKNFTKHSPLGYQIALAMKPGATLSDYYEVVWQTIEFLNPYPEGIDRHSVLNHLLLFVDSDRPYLYRKELADALTGAGLTREYALDLIGWAVSAGLVKPTAEALNFPLHGLSLYLLALAMKNNSLELVHEDHLCDRVWFWTNFFELDSGYRQKGSSNAGELSRDLFLIQKLQQSSWGDTYRFADSLSLTSKLGLCQLPWAEDYQYRVAQEQPNLMRFEGAGLVPLDLSIEPQKLTQLQEYLQLQIFKEIADTYSL